MERLNKSSFSPKDLLPWLLVAILAGIWASLLSWFAIAQHESFNNAGNDFGIYAQLVWTASEGRPFYSSLTRQTTNFLGHHFMPLVTIISPFYRIWPDARLMLIAQAIMLAAGSFPLFAFARRHLSQNMAFFVVIAYLLSPFLAFIGLFEFHEIALSVPFLIAAGAALLEKRNYATVLWLIPALLAKEEVALIAIGFGFYALFIQRRWRFGVGLTIGTLFWAVALFGWIIPTLNYIEKNYTFAYRYPSLGDTPRKIVVSALTKPALVLTLLSDEVKHRFLAELMLPLGGLPLLGLPAMLLAFPTLTYLMLSEYSLHFDITNHYSAPILPFLYLSAVVAIERMQRFHPKLGWAGIAFLLISALIGARVLSPLPGGANYTPEEYVVLPEHRQTHALLTAIPSEANVAAEWRYHPWLANRWMIDDVLNPTFRPINTVIPDFIVTKAPAAGARHAPTYPWLAPELSELDDQPLLQLPRYRLQDTSPDGTMIWTRRAAEEDVWLQRYNIPFERGMVFVGAGMPPEAPAWGNEIIASPDSTLPIWLAWGAAEPLQERISFTIQMFRDDERVAQVDKEMGSGRFATTHWHDWLDQPVVVSEFDLELPADLPPGRYRLLTGAYESETVTPLLQPDGNAWIELGTVVIPD